VFGQLLLPQLRVTSNGNGSRYGRDSSLGAGPATVRAGRWPRALVFEECVADLEPAHARDRRPLTMVQTCVIHLLRNAFRYASRRYWDELSKDLRPIYPSSTEATALGRFDEFAEKWGPRYPAIVKQWRSAWTELVPFLDYEGVPQDHLHHELHRCLKLAASVLDVHNGGFNSEICMLDVCRRPGQGSFKATAEGRT
jgi:hypothetical protein